MAMRKHVLFLLDGYDVAKSGIHGVHRSLMRHLSRADDIRVSCLVVKPLAEIPEDVNDAEKWNITLLSPTNDTDDDDDDDDDDDSKTDDFDKPLHYLTEKFKHYYPELPKQASDVTHLVAYAPHTAAVANDIRQWLGLRDIKLVLVIYNLLEAETGGLGSPDWSGAGIDCSADDVVSCARSADFVFSVGKDVFCHWDRELRVNDVAGVDHRRLMPACDEFSNIELLSPSQDHTPRIVTLMMDSSDDSARFMETAADAIGRAARSKNIDVTWEVQLPKLENSEKQRLISQWKGLAKTPLMKLVSTECRCREDVVKSLRKATMCIQAGEFLRCGYSGMEAIMAGVPTLVPKLSAVGRLIEELVNLSACPFLLNKTNVPYPDEAIDEWAKKIMAFIDHQKDAQENAHRMKQKVLTNDEIQENLRSFIDVFKGRNLAT